MFTLLDPGPYIIFLPIATQAKMSNQQLLVLRFSVTLKFFYKPPSNNCASGSFLYVQT